MKDEKQKEFEKNMIELIKSMTEGFDKETMSSGLYQHFLDNAEWFKEPETINCFIFHPVERATELIIEKAHNKPRQVASIWIHYGFIENNISKLCEQFYGSACCVDRGRFITECFIKFIETKKMPEFNWKQEYTYHYPEKGTMKQWVDFAEGVYELKYGLNKKYLLALKELMKVHSNKKLNSEQKHED